MTELYVERGEATKDELQETIDEILAEIATGEGELADEARAVGMSVDADTTIVVEEASQGFVPFAALALAFAGAAGKELAERFWEDVLLPEIRRRRSADAVGDRCEASDHED
jgi:hypothetical protein